MIRSSCAHRIFHTRGRRLTQARRLCGLGILIAATASAPAQWRVLSPNDQRQSQPPKNISEGTPIKLGDPCPNDQKFRWLVAELEIPATIGNEPTAGKVVGLQINCGDGGEVYVNDVLQARYDNDHPALVILSEQAAARRQGARRHPGLCPRAGRRQVRPGQLGDH